MSQTTASRNVELLRDGYRAFNESDIESVMAIMSDDIEWIEPEGLPHSGTHRGPEAIVENVFTPVMEQYEDLNLEVDRFVGDGDTVVVLGTARGRGRETGKSLENPFAHVYDIEDGQITRFVQHTNTYHSRDVIGA
ncbi:nuclear transport factor 2 family protein [Halorubrum trueperi]|uniref:Nuclear transport factor 2 family protein n=1 Tax=Halorubrum trueperi TaxID=2004704 RepID=A0ABD5UKJ7_9EURY